MNIISEAREFYYSHTDNYKRGNIWEKGGGNFSILNKMIKEIETPEDLIDALSNDNMFNITIRNEKVFNLMMDWYEDNFGSNILTETLCKTPNLWRMFIHCQSILSKIEKNNIILELGGGNGQFSFMAKNVIKQKCHIDIDIPESLYAAYVCTRHRFTEAKCLWVTNENDIELTDWDFVFIPTGKEKILIGKNIDLFVNTVSMGEMSNDNVRYWMDFIQNKINLSYLFTFNRFLNTLPNTGDWRHIRKNENECSVLYDKNWKIMKWEVEPLVSRCPYEIPRMTRDVEIIAKRGLSEKPCLENIKEEDWWFYKDIDPVATTRGNQLVHDLTMKGTLFKLWDAIRHENKEAVAMMLQYMSHIGRTGQMFEEEFYYKKIGE